MPVLFPGILEDLADQPVGDPEIGLLDTYQVRLSFGDDPMQFSVKDHPDGADDVQLQSFGEFSSFTIIDDEQVGLYFRGQSHRAGFSNVYFLGVSVQQFTVLNGNDIHPAGQSFFVFSGDFRGGNDLFVKGIEQVQAVYFIQSDKTAGISDDNFILHGPA